MFISRHQNRLIYFVIGASWFLCLIANAMVIDAFTVKNLRARDFSGEANQFDLFPTLPLNSLFN